jgi:chemotaxis protein MotB
MADESKQPPVIIIHKKIIAAGHHGGAWKVAFADFVTAMMALFIVLWLLNTSQNVKDSIAGYFKDPTGSGRMVGSALAGSGEAMQVKKEDLQDLKEKLEAAIKAVPEFKTLKDQVQITVTGEGLRIELMESKKNSFFESGNAQPSGIGKDFLANLAKEIGVLPNYVTIEGHTDAKPFSSAKGVYSNWELSADRANSARRLMEESGLHPNQVTQVRGFAAQRLRKRDDPEDPSNRRISIIVQYDVKVREEDKSILQKQHEKELKQNEEKSAASEALKIEQAVPKAGPLTEAEGNKAKASDPKVAGAGNAAGKQPDLKKEPAKPSPAPAQGPVKKKPAH